MLATVRYLMDLTSSNARPVQADSSEPKTIEVASPLVAPNLIFPVHASPTAPSSITTTNLVLFLATPAKLLPPVSQREESSSETTVTLQPHVQAV